MRRSLIGQRFGKLTVIGDAPDVVRIHPSGTYRRRVLAVKCDCGTEKSVPLQSLQSGNTQTCGCAQRVWAKAGNGHRSHGECVNRRLTTEYKIWAGIKARCLNPNSPAYKYYGGRGITICDKWRKSVKAFIKDMGRRPSKLYSIDRIDNNGNYEPGNCRWATASEQGLNRRPYAEWPSQQGGHP